MATISSIWALFLVEFIILATTEQSRIEKLEAELREKKAEVSALERIIKTEKTSTIRIETFSFGGAGTFEVQIPKIVEEPTFNPHQHMAEMRGKLNPRVRATGPSEKESVEALFNATRRVLPWDFATPSPCTFVGVTCVGSSIVQIDLSSRNLRGTIPSEIGNLVYLGKLVLAGNYFSGEIPSTIGALTGLKILDLNSNALTGTVPEEILIISSLIQIDVCNNQLEGQIPPLRAPALVIFTFCNNLFSGTFPALINASSLLSLNIGENSISGVIPYALLGLVQLKQLILGNNPLRGRLDGEFCVRLRNLQDLRVWKAHFEGTIPDEIGEMKDLVILMSFLSGLSGTLPSTIGNLVNLSVLALPQNSISGTIPTEIGKLKQLSLVALWRNSLTGSIPKEIGEMTNLKVLGLQSNQLSGCIPSELALSKMQSLILSDNLLSCSIPESVFNNPNLQQLWVNGNFLEGTFPTIDPRVSHSLYQIYASRNRLSGSIPTNVNLLSELIFLDISSNNFSGSIPPQLGDCFKLAELSLYQNHFQGGLPSTLAQLSRLNIFDASYNAFSGKLSDFISPLVQRHINCLEVKLGESYVNQACNANGLQVLNIEHNRLTGTIPPEILVFNNGFLLLVGNNDIYGPLPETNLLTLLQTTPLSMKGGAFSSPHWYVLDVSGTKVSGVIPSSWGNMTRLRLLNVSATSMQGDQTPDWMTLSGARTGRVDIRADCAVLTGKSKPMAIFLDAEYFGFRLCDCFDNFYSVNGTCVPCPNNAICSRGSVSIKKGYWGLKNIYGEIVTFPCPGGYCTDTPASLEGQCAGARTGVLCGECLSGYVKAIGSSSCVSEERCKDDGVLLSLIFLLTLLFSLYQLRAANDCYPGSLWNHFSSILKIATYYFQIAPLLLSERTLGNIGSVAGIIYEILNLKPNAGSSSICGMRSWSIVQKKLFVLLVPACLCLWLALATFVIFLRRLATSGRRVIRTPETNPFNKNIHTHGIGSAEVQIDSKNIFLVAPRHTRLVKSHKGGGPVDSIFMPSIHALFSILSLAYTTLLKTVFELLLCIRVGDELRLFAIGEVVCYTAWQAALFLVLIPLLGYPFFLYYLVYRLQRAKKIQRGGLTAIQQTSCDALMRLFSVRFPNWEAMLMLRRLIYVLIYTFLAESPRWRAWLFCVFSLAVAIHTLECKPFRSVNYVETYSLFSLTLITFRELALIELQTIGEGTITPRADDVGFTIIQNMLLYSPLLLYAAATLKIWRNIVNGYRKRRRQKLGRELVSEIEKETEDATIRDTQPEDAIAPVATRRRSTISQVFTNFGFLPNDENEEANRGAPENEFKSIILEMRSRKQSVGVC